MADEWTFEGKQFRHCPQCKKGIPAEWTTHNCGWGKAADLKPDSLQAFSKSDDRGNAIREMFDDKQGSIARSVAWKTAGEIIAGTFKKVSDLDAIEAAVVRLAKRGMTFLEKGE